MTQKLSEQKQEQQKEETKLQKKPQQPNTNKTLPSMMEEEKSLPPKTHKEQTWEHLLIQVVKYTKDKKWANILETEGNRPKKLWSRVERAKQGSNTFD